MRILEHAHPAAFLNEAHALFAAREVEHNLLLGVLKAVVDGRYAHTTPVLIGVYEESGALVGALVQTPPYPLLISDMPGKAADALADALVERDLLPCRVMGLQAISDRISQRLSKSEGVKTTPVAHMRLFRLDRVVHPRGTSGAMHPATPQDKQLLAEYFVAFHAEAVPHEPALSEPDRVAAGAIANGNAWLWHDEGVPVCMAAYGRDVGGGASIGPVYTPPERRGRGYASALVAALSQHLLDGGRRYTCLFTDLENPTSNKIYARIGYQPLCDFRQWDLVPGR